MNNIIKNEPQLMIALFKFGKKEHLETLKSGKLYMRNLQYFIEYEEENKSKGKGDLNEAALVINDVTCIFKDPLTGEEKARGKSKKTILRNTEDLSTPVFCMMCMKQNNLKKYSDDNYIMEFNDIQKNNIIKEFGDYVLVISPHHFIERIKKVFKEKNIEYEAGCVEYIDISQNNLCRLDKFQTNNRFFYKDKKFYEYQQEYRIVILNRKINSVKDNLTLDIGDISKFSSIMKTKQLLENGLLVEFIGNKK